jgi:glyoxylase-like metal-dependent hydrolase (beta-lactamase superfamily II)
MNNTVKWILRGFAVIACLLLIGATAYYFHFHKATKAMSPSETQALNDSVWCIKDSFVNAYIFKGRNSFLMVDAGIGKKNFKNELGKLGILPGQITTILLTHTDSDHTGAISLFDNPKIYMHRNEEQMINGTTGKTKFFKIKWKYGSYKLLASNDTLTIDGLKIKILLTPGHTPGSSCYIIGNDYFATGDNLIVKDGKYEPFIETFNMDTPGQIESIKALPPPDSFRYILTGHYGIIKVH